MTAQRTGSSMAANGGPSSAAATLYVGTVMHQRMKPRMHRFAYRVFSLCIDVDRLSEAGRQSRLFSVNGRNLAAFHEADHTGSPDIGLRDHVDTLLRQAGIDGQPTRVLLVCYPRIFGFVFNPLSVYYVYDAAETLVALIYEVRNTFGESHTYVCPIADGELTAGGVRQSCDKLFYVSPFIGMEMRYAFRMLPPGKEIRWRILETDKEGPLLSATFSGKNRPLDTPRLAALLGAVPFLTLKIVAGIHWEALKLWLKGIALQPRPAPPAPVSIHRLPTLAEAAE